MNRRQFLKTASALYAGRFIPKPALWGASAQSTVFEFTEISPRSIHALFSAYGGLANMMQTDPANATVVLKPNMCLPFSVIPGVTTSSKLLESFCAYLTGEGVNRIIILDHTLQQESPNKTAAIAETADKFESVRLVFSNQQRQFQPTEVPGKVLKSTETLKILDRADLVVNAATAKHHSATQVSLALKNLMGLVWNRAEFHTDFDLHQAIADLALIIRPDINIVDASRVLLNGGPTGPGPIATENTFFASTDICALDAVVASRFDFGGKSVSPQEIAHLHAAYVHGIGEINLNNISISRP